MVLIKKYNMSPDFNLNLEKKPKIEKKAKVNLEEPEVWESQKTTVPSVLKDKDRGWYLLDLKNKIPGRVATLVSILLRGKNRTDFLANFDLGNNVVLINASKIKFTGNKLKDKYYYNHSGYSGGQRERTAGVMLEKHTAELMKRIVWGMMPKTKLARRQLKRLHVFPTDKHNLQSQEKLFVKC